MKRIGLALALVAFIGGACVAQVPGSQEADRLPSEPAGVLDGCPFVSPDRFDVVVARAVSGLDDTTAGDGWSRACARLTGPGDSEQPTLVTLQVGWRGSLHEYAATPGAEPISGLGDEAYALEAGSRIAFRSGELVAVVSCSGATARATVAVARQVAAQLPE